jgi:hypothetical protein
MKDKLYRIIGDELWLDGIKPEVWMDIEMWNKVNDAYRNRPHFPIENKPSDWKEGGLKELNVHFEWGG